MFVPIPNYPDYAVNELGNIVRLTNRTNAKSGDPVPTQLRRNGYLYVSLSCLGKKAKKEAVHHVVLWAFVGLKPSPKHQAAHNNGNKLDNTKDNLRWATGQENAEDKRKHGTLMMGEKYPKAKLNPQLIAIIYERRSKGEPASRIAYDLNISDTLIYRLESGKAWKHLKYPVKKKSI